MGTSEPEDQDCEPDEQLRLNVERLRRAQAVGQVGSWELDLVRGTIWASKEAFRIYGLPLNADQHVTLSVVKAIALPAYRDALDRALDDLIARRAAYDVEFRIRRASDGEVRDIHSRAVLVVDPEGTATRIDGTIQDLTERKRMEQALRASEERTRMILEHAADAILLGDGDGTLIDANEKASALSGYGQQELLGENISMLFSASVLEAAPLRYDLLELGGDVVQERSLSRKDGSQVLVEMHTTRLPDGTLQSILRDVTERKKTDEQEQLRRRMVSIGTLAGGIAHDFNNLLAAIMGYASLLSAGKAALDTEQQDCVENILTACRRGADLVGGLAALARPASVGSTSFDLAHIANDVVLVLKETTNRLIDKNLERPPDPCFVAGRESDLYHALMNLGINAVQAIEERGARAGDRVSFSIGRYEEKTGGANRPPPGEYVRVIVRDTGPGMTPEVKKSAFDPLFSTKNKSARKGQGLGLTMVYHTVVTQHGGHIDLHTAPGEGTEFHLYLRQGAAAPAARAESRAITGGQGETILFIDDEPQILDLADRTLRRAGFACLTATDGRAGLDLFRQHASAVDVVVLDRTLPEMSGEAVLEALLRLEPKLRVVISSGDATVALDQFPGALALLRKPYSPGKLCATLRAVLLARR